MDDGARGIQRNLRTRIQPFRRYVPVRAGAAPGRSPARSNIPAAPYRHAAMIDAELAEEFEGQGDADLITWGEDDLGTPRGTANSYVNEGGKNLWNAPYYITQC